MQSITLNQQLVRNEKILQKVIIVFLCLVLSLSHLSARGQTYEWNNVAMGGGGFVSAIVTNKTEANLVYARTDVGGAYRWDGASSHWIPLIDWASQNETGYLGVESLATDPKEPNKLYILVGISYFNSGKTAILYSSDYGKNFTVTDVTSQFKAHGNGMGRQTGEKLIIDPNSTNILFCGTRWNGLFKSVDAGVSWNRVGALDVTTTPNENGISFVVLDPRTGSSGSATQTLFIGVSRTGANLYRSNDGGQTFNAVANAPTTFMPQRAVVAGESLFITYGNGAGPHGHWAVPEPMDKGQIWKYNMRTGTWTDVTPTGFNRAFGGICVAPNDTNRLVASTVNTYMLQDNNYGDRIFLSTDGGVSWTDVVARGFDIDPNGSPWLTGAIHWAGSIEFDPFDTKKAWVTSGNGVFRTDDINAMLNVWKFQVKGIEETVPADVVSIPNGPVVSVVYDYDGFRNTDVKKYGPAHSPRIGSTRGLAYAALNPKIILRAGGKMFHSSDMGLTWSECTMVAKDGYISVSADGSTFLHCPDTYTKTYRSIDKGATWTAVTGLNISSARFAADPVNPNKFYAYNPGNGAMMVSTNGGVSFSAGGSLNVAGSKIIRTAPGREGHLWVALNNNGLSRSTNSGTSFSKINGITYCGAVGLGKEAPGKNYPTVFIWGTVNGITGVYRSIDEGVSWLLVNDEAHEYGGPGNGQFVVGDMNVFGRVYLSTAGRGIAFGEPANSCVPANVIPYIQLNTESAQQEYLASVTKGSTVTLSPEPTEGGTWSWTGPNGFTSNQRVVTLLDIQSDDSGIYTAKYADANGCESGAQTIALTFINESVVGIDDEGSDLKVYPNPSIGGNISIANSGMGMLSIKIYDSLGSIVCNKEFKGNANDLQINAGLRPGVYLLRISRPGSSVFKKLVVN